MKAYLETHRRIYHSPQDAAYVSISPSTDGVAGLTEIMAVEGSGDITDRIVCTVDQLALLIAALQARYEEASEEEKAK